MERHSLFPHPSDLKQQKLRPSSSLHMLERRLHLVSDLKMSSIHISHRTARQSTVMYLLSNHLEAKLRFMSLQTTLILSVRSTHQSSRQSAKRLLSLSTWTRLDSSTLIQSSESADYSRSYRQGSPRGCPFLLDTDIHLP